jgi:hypothetical protein
MASRVKAGSKLHERARRVANARSPTTLGIRSNSESRSVTVRVPLALNRRGGRKLVVTPNGGAAWSAPRPHAGNTMVKALARAHRWKRMIESGDYASLTDLALAEKINHSYLGRILRLTLLAPDIAEAILDGRQPRSAQPDRFLRPIPIDWEQQRREFPTIQQHTPKPVR